MIYALDAMVTVSRFGEVFLLPHSMYGRLTPGDHLADGSVRQRRTVCLQVGGVLAAAGSWQFEPPRTQQTVKAAA